MRKWEGKQLSRARWGTQKTRAIHSALGKCRATVLGTAGTTSTYCLNILPHYNASTYWLNILPQHNASTYCLNLLPQQTASTNTTRETNASWMFGQCCRRWANIKPTLETMKLRCCPRKHDTQFIVRPSSTQLAQHQPRIGSTICVCWVRPSSIHTYTRIV